MNQRPRRFPDVLVRYPTDQDGEDTNLTTSGYEVGPPLTAASLGYLRYMREQTGNPLFRLMQLRLCNDANVYPSPEIMEWLAQGFEDWMANKGKKNLEQCLGLKKHAGQTANSFKELHRSALREELSWEIQSLRCAFKLSIKTAVGIVATRIAFPDRAPVYSGYGPYTEKTLKQYYRKERSKGGLLALGCLAEKYGTDEEKWGLLRNYPLYLWENQSKLKRFATWVKTNVPKDEWNDPDKLKNRSFSSA